MVKYRRIILGSLQMFIGVGAVAAGLGFILEPDGSNLGLSIEVLAGSPFDSYLVPGILLLVVNGLGNVGSGVFSFTRHRLVGYAAMFFGGALAVWIIVQVIMIGYSSWLQPTYLVLGTVEFVLGATIERRRIRSAEPKTSPDDQQT